MPAKRILPLLLLVTSILLSACGAAEGATTTDKPDAAVQITPDPCAPENIAKEVEKVHKIMREFDDASLLAQYTPRNQLNPSISTLQRIRRDAEDQPVPTCLVTLKQRQLAHMNTVINTFLGLLSGADEDTINQSITLARQQHDQYIMELASVLGLTVPAPSPGTPNQDSGIFVFNPGQTPIELRSEPDANAQSLGFLEGGASTLAVGRNADGTWIQVAVPDQPGLSVWVSINSIQLSGSPEALPITSP